MTPAAWVAHLRILSRVHCPGITCDEAAELSQVLAAALDRAAQLQSALDALSSLEGTLTDILKGAPSNGH